MNLCILLVLHIAGFRFPSPVYASLDSHHRNSLLCNPDIRRVILHSDKPPPE